MSKRPRASILVVDDNKEIVEAIHDQFTFCGFEVIKAVDPKRALELSSLIKPDIIIADIRMPKLDGITLIKKFKATQPNVKVILMTGYYPDYEAKIQEALASGLADRVIQKRYRALDLEKLVYEVLKTPSEEMLFSTNAKGKLLFVDDEEEVIDFLRGFFREKGYAVSVAKTAEDAVDAYESFEPDVVITDIKMPKKDGIWLIKELRTRKKDVRVIAMTGQDNEVVINELRRETGIQEYFSKPFGTENLEKLSEKLSETLTGKKADDVKQ